MFNDYIKKKLEEEYCKFETTLCNYTASELVRLFSGQVIPYGLRLERELYNVIDGYTLIRNKNFLEIIKKAVSEEQGKTPAVIKQLLTPSNSFEHLIFHVVFPRNIHALVIEKYSNGKGKDDYITYHSWHKSFSLFKWLEKSKNKTGSVAYLKYGQGKKLTLKEIKEFIKGVIEHCNNVCAHTNASNHKSAWIRAYNFAPRVSQHLPYKDLKITCVEENKYNKVGDSMLFCESNYKLFLKTNGDVSLYGSGYIKPYINLIIKGDIIEYVCNTYKNTLFMGRSGVIYYKNGYVFLSPGKNIKIISIYGISMHGISVYGGEDLIFFFTNTEKIYYYCNDEKTLSYFGLKLELTDSPKLTTLIKNKIIKKVVFGVRSLIFLTTTGDVYCCGDNGEGQLGLGKNIKKTVYPIKISFYKNVKICEISAGYYYSLFLTETGDVYGCGHNEFGQFGLGKNIESTTYPTKIFFPGDTKIRAISTGSCHSLFLTTTGDVWGCGGNWRGQLGLGKGIENSKVPRHIKKFFNIEKIECGFFQSFFISKDKKIFACGYNEGGELWPDGRKSIYLPALVKTF